MKIKLPGRMWEFKNDRNGNEIGEFKPYSKENEIYIDGLHYDRLKNVYTKRQKHQWDNWIIYAGDEGDGKSTMAKQDCYIMSKLCGGKFDVNQISWEAKHFDRLIDESEPGDSVLYDEGITGLDTQRTMSEVNHILRVKSTMCRKKKLFVGICIPSLFDLQKGIAVRRSFGMVKVYSDEVKRGFFTYYNRLTKRILYIKGKKFEDMDAHKGANPSRFLLWSFIDEIKYEKRKDEAHREISKEKSVFSRYKVQRNALIKWMWFEKKLTQKKIAEILSEGTNIDVTRQTIQQILAENKEIPKETAKSKVLGSNYNNTLQDNKLLS